MILRSDKDTFFIDIARRCGMQSTCLRRHFGAVIIDDYGTIVSTGYNGAPKGELHCTKCWRMENNIPSGSNYEKCRSVHAEMNALLQAGKNARGSKLYIIGSEKGVPIAGMPCYLCAKMIVNAEILFIITEKEDKIVKYYPKDILREVEQQALKEEKA